MSGEIFSVLELNTRVKSLIEYEPSLQGICVRGEISNFTNHASGHLYFSIKDEQSTVRCVMFKGNALRLNSMPKDGMKVLLYGDIGLYAKGGYYQIIAKDMRPDGVGELYRQYEALKEKLAALGMFDEKHKKPIVKYPKRVGVVTSKTGAVIHDIINVSRRRYPLADIVLYPAAVQGADTAPSIISGIEYFNRVGGVDTIIVGRGGGSIEDLWGFNDEALAHAVFNSKIPIISAVGHESDFTICDFVADRRAPTPSAAAEIAFPSLLDIRAGLGAAQARMQSDITGAIKRAAVSLANLRDRGPLSSSERFFNRYREDIAVHEKDMRVALDRHLSGVRARLSIASGKLSALSPLAVLARGYSLTYDKDNNTVTDADCVSVGDIIYTRLGTGRVTSRVEGTENGDNDG